MEIPEGTAEAPPGVFVERVFAYLIDGVVLVVLSLAAVFIIVRYFAEMGKLFPYIRHWFPFIRSHVFLASLLVSPTYYIGLWSWRGQTLGKMALGIRIVKTNGAAITLGTAVLRYIGYWVSAAALFMGFFMVAWDSKEQGLHDKIAHTYVVKV